MVTEQGEIIIYQLDDGTTSLEVRLEEETVWLTQAQLVEFFQKTKQNVSLHIRNIFQEGELREDAVVKEYLTTAPDGKRYRTKYYNLDIIISVGYRIKSLRGTQFRIWATRVLKEHLVKGYTVNERRLAEQGLADMEQAVALLSRTLARHEALSEEGRAVLAIVNRYAKSWSILLRYDEDRLELPKDRHPAKRTLDHGQASEAIAALKADLVARGQASDLFGQEREQHLAGILGSISQTFGGQDSTRQRRRRPPTCFTLRSRITPFPMATNGSAPFSLYSFCKKTASSAGPESTTTPWWPWPCSSPKASLAIRS